MAPGRPLNDEQRRLLRITARMPLASAANLVSVMALDEDNVRRMLNRLRSGGWVSSVMRGMSERRQHRYFLTSQAVALDVLASDQPYDQSLVHLMDGRGVKGVQFLDRGEKCGADPALHRAPVVVDEFQFREAHQVFRGPIFSATHC